MRITFLGHAAIRIETEATSFLIDPFLTGNPKAAVKAEDLNPDYILITHGHDDHVGDTLNIAKRTGAEVITTFELGNWLAAKGAKAIGQGLGGWGTYPFGKIKFTPALHSSSTIEKGGRPLYLGEPAGVVLQIGGKTIYHAGDTALFSDMRLIGEDTPVDLAILPIGEFYTMGPKDAAKAVGFLRPKQVIPVHYGTFPPLIGDPQEFAQLVGDQSKVNILTPGESVEL
jgi:L-ascorbate metabolism protein UlaG (beta-lactamase superfamily)